MDNENTEDTQEVVGSSRELAEEIVLETFHELLKQLTELKPNDRSAQDRYWAIVKTEVEKAQAVFHMYVYEEYAE